MSNIHHFKPRPKAPKPRKRLPFARAPWLGWVLVLAAAVVLTVVGAGGTAIAISALAIILIGGWLDQRS